MEYQPKDTSRETTTSLLQEFATKNQRWIYFFFFFFDRISLENKPHGQIYRENYDNLKMEMFKKAENNTSMPTWFKGIQLKHTVVIMF